MKSIHVVAAGLMLAVGSASVLAQHAGHGVAAAAPYASMQSRDIKALSTEDTERLLRGEGMSLALAAELNGYPGPVHVLELAGPLGLSASQRERTQSLMARHKVQARELGARLVDSERELDRAFAGGQVTPAEVARLTRRIGETQSELRVAHLQTHLEQKALLTAQQIARYQELRGYGEAAQAPADAAHSGHATHH
jgi:hypothetical protein